jgi:uncharacterized protein (DUF2252 family)
VTAVVHRHHHPTVEERRDLGRQARIGAPRSTLGDWKPPDARPNAVDLIEEQNTDRVPWLVPIRRGRMMANPFSYFRGAARVMASDLSGIPSSGLTVQLGGDAHLSNFGTYASPERRLVFDQNDFDETLPGPFEWDVARLSASLVLAARHLNLSPEQGRAVTTEALKAFRLGVGRLADKPTLEIWYDHFDVDTATRLLGESAATRNLRKFVRKAHSRDNRQAVRKLTVETPEGFRIRNSPPVLFPIRDAAMHLGSMVDHEIDSDDLQAAAERVFTRYRSSLPHDLATLLSRYTAVDVGVKVVGVGSVGTRCFIVLLEGRDRQDPLMLQVKEATSSVLEEFVGHSRFHNHGRRVVEGQHLIQSVSDIFLGWTEDPGGHNYYIRQLRDWKGSFDVETADLESLTVYATACGFTLAHGHARSGDAVALSTYLGKGENFDKSMLAFAEHYADLNESDYHEFVDAIHDGPLDAVQGV